MTISRNALETLCSTNTGASSQSEAHSNALHAKVVPRVTHTRARACARTRTYTHTFTHIYIIGILFIR